MVKTDRLILIGIIVLLGKEHTDWIRYEVGQISKN